MIDFSGLVVPLAKLDMYETVPGSDTGIVTTCGSTCTSTLELGDQVGGPALVTSGTGNVAQISSGALTLIGSGNTTATVQSTSTTIPGPLYNPTLALTGTAQSWNISNQQSSSPRQFVIRDVTAGVNRFTIDTLNRAVLPGNLSVASATTPTDALDVNLGGGGNPLARIVTTGAGNNALLSLKNGTVDWQIQNSGGTTGSPLNFVADSTTVGTATAGGNWSLPGTVQAAGTLLTETSAPSAISGADVIYGDSTLHWPKMNSNGGGWYPVTGTSGTPASGNCAKWISSTVIADAGSACSGLSGSGTANYLPKWTGATALGNSNIYQDGSGNVEINGTSPGAGFDARTSVRLGSYYAPGDLKIGASAYSGSSQGVRLGGWALNDSTLNTVLYVSSNAGGSSSDVIQFGDVSTHLTQATSNTDIAGVLTCSSGTAGRTFSTSFASPPVVIVSDETTAGGARVSAKGATSFTVTCAGASDIVDYVVIGNPN